MSNSTSDHSETMNVKLPKYTVLNFCFHFPYTLQEIIVNDYPVCPLPLLILGTDVCQGAKCHHCYYSLPAGFLPRQPLLSAILNLGVTSQLSLSPLEAAPCPVERANAMVFSLRAPFHCGIAPLVTVCPRPPGMLAPRGTPGQHGPRRRNTELEGKMGC